MTLTYKKKHKKQAENTGHFLLSTHKYASKFQGISSAIHSKKFYSVLEYAQSSSNKHFQKYTSVQLFLKKMSIVCPKLHQFV